MKKTFFLILIIILIGCTKENPSNQPIPDSKANTIDLKVDNNKIEDESIEISAFYNCEETISVYISSQSNQITSELMSLTFLKTGELVHASYVDKETTNNTRYQTADFIPSSTINIDEFEFMENENLTIKFSGQLLKYINSYFDIPETVDIQADLRVSEFGQSFCNTFPDFIRLDDNISSINISRSTQGFNQNQLVTYESITLQGERILFNNFNESIKNMPLGTYNFNDLSTTEKIEFSQYVGPSRYFSSSVLIPQDWKVYQCNGSFTILEKNMIDGEEVTTVTMNFTASYNGIVEYTFNIGLLKTNL